jgi:hypothetical protein
VVQRRLGNRKLVKRRLRRGGRRLSHVRHTRLSRDGRRHTGHLWLRADNYRRAWRKLLLLVLLVLMLLMMLMHGVAVSLGHPTLLRRIAHMRAGMTVVGLSARVVSILGIRVLHGLLLVELLIVLVTARLMMMLHGRRMSRQSGLRNMRLPCRQMMVHHAGG